MLDGTGRIALPIPWKLLDTMPTASLVVAEFPAHFAPYGDTLFNDATASARSALSRRA
jgi:hypothetical protein